MKILIVLLTIFLIVTGTGCSNQKEEAAVIKVVDLFFNAIQKENNKESILELADKNTPAEKNFTDDSLYIGKLIEKSIKTRKVNNKNAVVEVTFRYNDGFYTLDQGNHDSNEVIIITLIRKNNEWKISNVEKG